MNAKTAKLIRKYSSRSQEEQGSVRRRWLALSHDERRRFRQKMLAAVKAEEK